jgi:hypothetical protein
MSDFFLQIISGVQVGKKVRIADKLTMGRAAENDISFSGADGTLVSGRHAVIERFGNGLIVRDLGSTNGTYVNGEPVTGERDLRPDEVISLGVSGPKLRLLDRALGGVGDVTALKAPTRAGSSLESSVREAKLARTEFEPRRPGSNAPPQRPNQGFGPGRGGFPPSGEDAGNYTMGLAQRLKDDEAGHDELKGLIKDKGRAERIVNSGVLSKRDAMMIHSAASTYSSHRKRAWWILGTVSLVAGVIVGILAYQNMGYRGKLKQQEQLLAQRENLEAELAAEKQKGLPAENDEEKQLLVAKLRAAERQLMSVRSNLQSKDLINTYKNPLGREIHTIMAGFGKSDYIVPDIFIKQVEKHINAFNTSPGLRAIIEKSLRNKDKYHRLIESELLRQGMPLAFLYLAMHESTLDSAITSHAGARGIWQFMPSTARDYGLRVPADWQSVPAEEDERTNPALSTRAGVKYVKTLYAEFGDVALAMAAYNAGEGRIRAALRSIDDPINNRDFWYIYRVGILADETNEYVPKIIATMIVDKNRERYGFSQ